MNYLSVEELKSRLAITGVEEDAVLTAVIAAASRQVDHLTGRSFARVEDEARMFTPVTAHLVVVDDLIGATSLATDPRNNGSFDEVWDAADYLLLPERAEAATTVQAIGSRTFPFRFTALGDSGRLIPYRSVRITGDWGWPAVPAPVKEATALLATRLYKRKDAPFGVVGSPELGQMTAITRRDPDAELLLAPYRLLSVVL